MRRVRSPSMDIEMMLARLDLHGTLPPLPSQRAWSRNTVAHPAQRQTVNASQAQGCSNRALPAATPNRPKPQKASPIEVFCISRRSLTGLIAEGATGSGPRTRPNPHPHTHPATRSRPQNAPPNAQAPGTASAAKLQRARATATVISGIVTVGHREGMSWETPPHSPARNALQLETTNTSDQTRCQ